MIFPFRKVWWEEQACFVKPWSALATTLALQRQSHQITHEAAPPTSPLVAFTSPRKPAIASTFFSAAKMDINVNPSDVAGFREFLQVYRDYRQQEQRPAPILAPAPAPALTATVPPPSQMAQSFMENQEQVPETPIAHRYQSGRAAPLPLVAPASYESHLPVQGMGTLAPSATTLNTTHVNRARMRSAMNTLPRGPTLVDPDGRQDTLYIYRLLHTDFVNVLETLDMAYQYEFPLDFPINQLIERVVADMVSSSSAYVFPVTRRASIGAPITTLQPLGLVSKGRVHHNQVRVQVQPLSLNATIGQMAADRNRFAQGENCIADRRFIIRLGVMGYPLINVETDRRHTCVSNRQHGEDLEDTSGGESEEERDAVAQQLWSSPVARASPSPPTRPVSTRPVTPAALLVSPARYTLPHSIWDENTVFNPTLQNLYNQQRFTDAVFLAATRGSGPIPPFRVRGADVEAAADDLTRQLDVAGAGPSGPDYTNILSNNRAFGLIGNQAAVGEGLEREAMYLVFTRFVQQRNAWFQPVAGGFLAIRTLYPLSSSIPPGRLVDATRLGAICGLLMVFGQCPGQISPAIFQYLIHNGNFASLRAPFIGEWFPEMRNTLLELLAKAPDDDLSQFAPQLLTYLDMEASSHALIMIPLLILVAPQVSAFDGRGLAGHLALGVNLLHKSTLGNSTFDKPELAIRNFHGGSETFLNLIATSRIVDADSLLPHLNALELPNQHVHTAALRVNTGDITLTLAMLFERYFRAAYIPCPLQFGMARGAFHPIVDLDRIEEPGFRARVFAWAATGSPFIDPTEGRIHLGPIETRDQGYGNAQSREFLASNGTIVFRTCLRSARYPIDYVLQLSQRHYSPEGEPADFQEAFDFWFLQQCLLAIGRHNML
ncbi:hypothetical protein C8R43DRAFT_951776 [Mycena crocata]|nr:hypothetical protein C8R43DRAFT_951776 [Mycena crocata]